MPGMEQLEINSKSYLVRWVNAKAQHTISWSIQPHKKSINFGIFKHPGSGVVPAPKHPTSTFETPGTPGLKPADGSLDFPTAPPSNHPSAAIEKLLAIGLKLIAWHGTCEANQVASGKYDVPQNEGGMYALVFDNTFAKSFSKTVTFVLLTYPTDNAPSSKHQVNHVQGAAGAGSSLSLRSQSKPSVVVERQGSSDSTNTLFQPDGTNGSSLSAPHISQDSTSSMTSSFYTGMLQKRRRKRHQGYARRFFSLDFSTSTLSYYHDKNTPALRGAVPLSLAAIGANATTREISIDSGAEVWHLRAPSQRDFELWKGALEAACRGPTVPPSPNGLTKSDTLQRRHSSIRFNAEEDKEWIRIESLVDRVASSRDAARVLAKDTDPKYLPQSSSNSHLSTSLDQSRMPDMSSSEASPVEHAVSEDYFHTSERRPFWKRKPSGTKPLPTHTNRSVSAQPVLSSSMKSTLTPPDQRPASSKQPSLHSFPESTAHEHCMSLLQDLDAIVAEFSTLIAESRQRRMAVPATATSRMSFESAGSQEYFDAEGGDNSQLLTIQHESDEEGNRAEHGFGTDTVDESSSEIEEGDSLGKSGVEGESTDIFPAKPKSLAPLPSQPIPRRTTVPAPPRVMPPSLIAVLRKNVGKDLSTISTPVAANEPISLLQKISEQLEYSNLLDDAAKDSLTSMQRLLYVTAFAVSSLSSNRVKERALRKPFNPMLGETFEMIREDKGFRFIAEKVSHRPVILACLAESETWSLSQSASPTQKFWGKSVELIIEGRVRVSFHEKGDRFSWTPATIFLRNIIAGEKYLEPVGTMTVTNERTGEYALVTFKAKGMFSGRSDEVVVQTYDSFGDEQSTGLAGKWTQALTIVENGTAKAKPWWTTGELVPDSAKYYGFTAFTASLNEISPRDKMKMAPTDSRLRADQRAAEEGDIDTAERVKVALEEAQRERRQAMTEEGKEWQPAWFTRTEGREGEEIWKPRPGKDSYWEHRTRGDWSRVTRVFDI